MVRNFGLITLNALFDTLGLPPPQKNFFQNLDLNPTKPNINPAAQNFSIKDKSLRIGLSLINR